ncbi:DNA polymerase-3 subunit gamma/tau [Pullulanibacillus pueri]|uniref:DNA-directed DNA polymerase n=1 Tax=Pullulanibacillus pueri TaxID=1437324 RepID=A0A8J2ZZP1_9BACL|nr:DNA polymerase III subunit gamma/tau [Pullulanibacillus pueri]MBM7684179.1 DNA polymerase-3 subunit gamma/tau [Pullulanibacillus pueri]GGH88805.1 DNA polymerase III subunit gamma/tau [Pullulanibacillus pueri]
MSYQALYRVWRPQQFKDMAGQEHITQTLQNALMKEKFSHAYLFSGPRGTGKTTIAKIIAKAINCEHAPVKEPCNECSTCIGITNGSISDVIEIDAASNNGVDEIREIRDNVKYAPSAARYKVYIIDEVHMLSQGAFNALLKTLEEPPQHVIFILATTEPHKIPLTIVSRCQRFDFKRISNDSIIKRLKYIIQQEAIPVDDDALMLVARASEGGMRDALSILDQASAYGGDEVKAEDVLEVTGMASEETLSKLLGALLNQEITEAIQLINDLIERGKDPGKFIEDLIFYCRDLLLYKSSPQLEELADRSRLDDHFVDLANKVPIETLYQYIQQLSQTQQEMKWTSHPKVFLEVAMVKLSRLSLGKEKGAGHTESSEQMNELVHRIEKIEERLKTIANVPQSQAIVEQQPSEAGKRRRSSAGGKPLTLPLNAMKHVLKDATKSDLKSLRASWADVMERVRQTHVAAHAWLLESKPVASSNDAFLQAFKYDFHCQMVLENKSNVLQMVEDILSEVVGTRKKMYPIPIKAWEELREEFIKEKETTDEPSTSEEDGKIEEENPLITEAEKLVGPDLLEIKD